jgi:hypothetical protein
MDAPQYPRIAPPALGEVEHDEDGQESDDRGLA